MPVEGAGGILIITGLPIGFCIFIMLSTATDGGFWSL